MNLQTIKNQMGVGDSNADTVDKKFQVNIPKDVKGKVDIAVFIAKKFGVKIPKRTLEMLYKSENDNESFEIDLNRKNYIFEYFSSDIDEVFWEWAFKGTSEYRGFDKSIEEYEKFLTKFTTDEDVSENDVKSLGINLEYFTTLDAFIEEVSIWESYKENNKDEKDAIGMAKGAYYCEILLDELGYDASDIEPTLYSIDTENKTIVCYEVCDTKDLDLKKYKDLWWLLDNEGWWLHIIHYDLNGKHRIIDIFDEQHFDKELEKISNTSSLVTYH